MTLHCVVALVLARGATLGRGRPYRERSPPRVVPSTESKAFLAPSVLLGLCSIAAQARQPFAIWSMRLIAQPPLAQSIACIVYRPCLRTSCRASTHWRRSLVSPVRLISLYPGWASAFPRCHLAIRAHSEDGWRANTRTAEIPAIWNMYSFGVFEHSPACPPHILLTHCAYSACYGPSGGGPHPQLPSHAAIAIVVLFVNHQGRTRRRYEPSSCLEYTSGP